MAFSPAPSSSRHSIIETHKHPRDSRITIDRRSSSRFYQMRARIGGRLRQKSAKTDNLAIALSRAAEWYKREMRAVDRSPRITVDPVVAEVYSAYKSSLLPGKRGYAEQKWSPIKSFWGALLLSEINAQTFRQFYQWRRSRSKSGVSNNTLHKDVVLIRQILRYALENEQIDSPPVIPKPGKIARNPRPWLTPQEWTHLDKVSRDRVEAVRKTNPKLYRQRQDLHDFMVFMLNSMMRVDEVRALRVTQIRYDEKADHLLIDAVGKSGHRTVVAKSNATEVYVRRVEDGWIAKDGRLFEHHPRDAFRELLVAAGLRKDAFGVLRNLKSLRPTAISFALLENPQLNLAIVSKNSGTSLQMLNDFYLKRLSAEMHVKELAP